MSGFKLHHVVFFVSLALLASNVPISRAQILEKWTVHILNSISGNRTLFVHCKSKDNDLGVHNLTEGSEFKWSFRTNVGGTTLFYCYLRTDQQQFAAFDAFWHEVRHDWLRVRCSHDHMKDCVWSAGYDGIYLKNLATYQDELIHEWGTHWHGNSIEGFK